MCVFSYLLNIKYRNTQSSSKMRTFWLVFISLTECLQVNLCFKVGSELGLGQGQRHLVVVDGVGGLGVYYAYKSPHKR